MIKKYLKTFIIFLTFDSIWLIFISPTFYKAHIAHLLADEPNFLAALFFYLIFIAGLQFFSVTPSLSSNRKHAFARGAFFGCVTYATFDLTSQAVFRDWPTVVTVVDLAWGSFLSGITTMLSSRGWREYLPKEKLP
jgi:uncharacterized membrane protein